MSSLPSLRNLTGNLSHSVKPAIHGEAQGVGIWPSKPLHPFPHHSLHHGSPVNYLHFPNSLCSRHQPMCMLLSLPEVGTSPGSTCPSGFTSVSVCLSRPLPQLQTKAFQTSSSIRRGPCLCTSLHIIAWHAMFIKYMFNSPLFRALVGFCDHSPSIPLNYASSLWVACVSCHSELQKAGSCVTIIVSPAPNTVPAIKQELRKFFLKGWIVSSLKFPQILKQGDYGPLWQYMLSQSYHWLVCICFWVVGL